MFKRKVYEALSDWKHNWAGEYACLIEGARRVGKTTIAEEFARNEYDSYIKVDFADTDREVLAAFNELSDLNRFFLRLQTATGISLKKRRSVIIFDEVQLYPRARQAIKYLVKDGRYDYIETGSFISIKKNVQNILIPSEEKSIHMYPMDYEEFLWATGYDAGLLRQALKSKEPLGNAINRKLMRDFRLYLAVGGMPQAVAAYLESNNLNRVDEVKREIIRLYKSDLKKVDPSGRLGEIYDSVPSQLALKKSRFVISAATKKRITGKDYERLADLNDSFIVYPCYHVANPGLTLSQTKSAKKFKLYLSDAGLFTTMLFHDTAKPHTDIYRMLLSGRLSADLGFLYENAAAQMIVSAGHDLYYHTWSKENSTHSYEIDFLLSSGKNILPLEIKSSSIKNHASLDAFAEKYKKYVRKR